LPPRPKQPCQMPIQSRSGAPFLMCPRSFHRRSHIAAVKKAVGEHMIVVVETGHGVSRVGSAQCDLRCYRCARPCILTPRSRPTLTPLFWSTSVLAARL
jgi:hypothetical protein